MMRITVMALPLWLFLVAWGEASAQVLDRNLQANEQLTGPEIPGPSHSVIVVPEDRETSLVAGATVGAAALTAALWVYTLSVPGETNRGAFPAVAGSFAAIAQGTMAVTALTGYRESESWSTAVNLVGLAGSVALVVRHARSPSMTDTSAVAFGVVPLVTADGGTVTFGLEKRF
jgi:hypothetical protein